LRITERKPENQYNVIVTVGVDDDKDDNNNNSNNNEA
jgi:hypothetical protein